MEWLLPFQGSLISWLLPVFPAVRIKPTNRRLILKDLKPLSMYKVLIQASTGGGSRNGTILTFKTEETGSEFIFNK